VYITGTTDIEEQIDNANLNQSSNSVTIY